MTLVTWQGIEEQLRAIGIVAPRAARRNGGVSSNDDLTSASRLRIESDQDRSSSPVLLAEFDCGDTTPDASATVELLASLRATGGTFHECVADSEVVVRGVESLSSDLQAALDAYRGDIRRALMPAESKASTVLLKQLGVEPIFIDDEKRAAEELLRLCTATDTIGLDIETAPRPEFLPVLWPIAVTNEGQRAKAQPMMDTAAALDAFRAEVRLLQLACEIDGRIVALVIDLRRVPLHSEAFAPLWKSKLVGHNLSFDLKMLVANGVNLDEADIVDTILMSGLVLRGVADTRREGSRRASLKAAVEEALSIELPKASQISPWWRDELSDEQIAYAALDAVLALKLAYKLQPRIDARPRGVEALTRLNAAVIPVARMELAGITLDREGLREQVDSWKKDLVHLQREIAAIGIANPSSGLQVAAWLRQGLQSLDAETGSRWLTTWPRTESGALSTKAKHLRRLTTILPGAELLVRYSAVAQLRSNFGEKLLACISAETGRLHGNFSIAAAKSGRFSSSKPNLQNIPKSESMRSLFVAAPGKVLVVADYSQLELRVMAAIAHDSVMTEAYRNGLDLHAVTAAGMLGTRPEEFDPSNQAHKEARQKAKAVNFGVIYGSGPGGLQEFARDAYGVVMSLDEAQRVIDRFLATYPGVAAWQKRQANRSRRERSASTMGGRVYRFAWEPKGEYTRNLALNLPVQGTAAEIALEATIRIDRRLRAELDGRADLVLQVHDEFVVEIDDEADTVASTKRVLEEEMTAAFTALLPAGPTTGLAEAHSGPSWAAAKG